MPGSQRPYNSSHQPIHSYPPPYGPTDQRPPPPPPPPPPVQRAPVAYVTPGRQQAPYPPSLNPSTPNGQSSANSRSSNAPYGGSSHFYDPVERSPEVSNSSSSWGYNNYRPPIQSPTSASSQHGTTYDVIRDRPVEPSSRPQAPQAPKLPISVPRAPQAPKAPQAPQAPVAAVAPVIPPTPRTPTENKQQNGSSWASNTQLPNSQRRDGAMSISSLLSNPTSESRDQTSPPPVETPTKITTKTMEHEGRNGHQPTTSHKAPNKQAVPKASSHSSSIVPHPSKQHRQTAEKEHTLSQSQSQSQSTQDSFKKSSSFKDFKYHDSMNIDNAEYERADETDVDEDVYAEALNMYKENRRKRKLVLMSEEDLSRKRRVLLLGLTFQDKLTECSEHARNHARERFEPEAANIIKAKAEEEEKQRKKEQQKTRRREKTANAAKIREEQRAKDKAEAAAKKRKEDDERKAQIAEEKSRLDDESIHDTDNSAAVVVDADGAKIKKRRIAPKKAKAKAPVAKEEPPVPEKIEPHVSKGYNLMYEQIWKDIARRDVPKVFKIQQSSLNIKQSNLRKTAQLAAKEARRWQQRTNKNVKDTQARAKRSMREMLTFWKRNEKEERDNRRKAEKEAIERAKREEEMREQKRQARKLNFLISQTELYSHFVGRKIKTNELERSTDTAIEGPTESAAEKVPEAVKAGVTGVAGPKKFEDLDFDNDDETHLHQAAMHNAQAALQETQDRARAFNAGAEKTDIDMEDGEMNFQNPTGLGDIEITQPKLLSCQLKEYQIKGLNWLANLYEQGINGILADEMGLGKTVQSISVMAYLAEKYDIWGPYLVVAPASTLHNWAQEISKFVPEFKVLPYWGNQRDRQILRKFWDRKSPTYRKDAQFHVLITSYQIVVGDAQYFQKMRWQYMILDEAQAIKSSQSSRWKTLLGMQCRNRLLLTGTPIQNSMQELWALLHFIMPGLFDSHDEFSEWFSKDIESHTQSNTQLNEQQLHRLHMILKPFMLRRVKKHVQKELGDKLEIDVYCDLTYRQRSIYKSLRDKLSVMDWLEKASNNTDDGAQSLMNLVMQFRKVCNHPDLFERAEVRSPLSLAYFADTISFMREKNEANLFYTTRNHVTYTVPHKVYSEDGNLRLIGPNSQAGMRRKILHKMMGIWTPDYIDKKSRENGQNAFSWLRFVDSSPQDVSRAANSDIIDRISAEAGKRDLSRFAEVYDDEPFVPEQVKLLITDLNSKKAGLQTTHEGIMNELTHVYESAFKDTGLANLPPAHPKATAPPVALICDDRNANIMLHDEQFDPKIRKALLGPTPLEQQRMIDQEYEICNYPKPPLLPEPTLGKGYSFVQAPSMSRFVTDSGKLLALDKLLMELKAGGHRVLLYFQMTRMMDLAEEYLAYRKYKYLRLDGSSKVEDRRDMVSDFQAKPEIFIFLLSTRAGGLGLNLTAADCVIFYDSDWNPTVDQQAEDRAHRLGQTKQVRVYRLLTRGTIEERIRARACQKQDVQKVVMTGKATEKKPVDFSKGGNRDMALWLFDEETIEAQLAEKQKEKDQEKAAKKGARKGKKAVAATPKKSAEALLESMYHEGEGTFDGGETADGASTPGMKKKAAAAKGGKKPTSKKKSAKERLSMADGF